ncbi:3-deoxy-manno-octulosonate cytidylyltransferase (CMP-KDO synthetase) [Marinobacter sp. DSM 26671]|uniref:3-deoxy-manno-octulosonate cytidylyltransferase n=1 Tax=Marinobacter sp. DSM 26671 TaxID=1761793 RepID=UPI0008EC7D89|nr:3-deoxy-manno-octulosonate cytidylyltransferase [Marinobacter sp. DSM 26671]SFE23766.1 3-deoxy-manno-octulosonate cytidylyltransferase (CMP-KDO synthetase) [Marinobacter sp. DSM 26671]
MYNSKQPGLRVAIPARFASTRLPGKPLVDLAGEPMIVRVFRRVEIALPDADIVVATDDPRIVEVLEFHGIPFVETDVGHDSGSDRIAEVARLMEWPAEDIILNVQGDEPLIPLELLRAFVAFCRKRPELEIASVAVPLTTREQLTDSNIVKVVMDQKNDALLFSRSPIPFCRDGDPNAWPLADFARHVGIYAYRNVSLQGFTNTPVCRLEQLEHLEQLRALWLGMKISMMRWHSAPPHGVDTPSDVQRVIETLLNSKE